MASLINAIAGGAGGLATSGDTSGTLQIQTGGTTAITVDASQNVAAAGNVTVTGSLTAGTYVGVQSIGVGQTWQSVTRTSGVTYTNSTGKPIFVNVLVNVNNTSGTGATITVDGVLVSTTLGAASGIGMAQNVTQSAIVPNGSTYVITGNFSNTAVELR